MIRGEAVACPFRESDTAVRLVTLLFRKLASYPQLPRTHAPHLCDPTASSLRSRKVTIQRFRNSLELPRTCYPELVKHRRRAMLSPCF